MRTAPPCWLDYTVKADPRFSSDAEPSAPPSRIASARTPSSASQSEVPSLEHHVVTLLGLPTTDLTRLRWRSEALQSTERLAKSNRWSCGRPARPPIPKDARELRLRHDPRRRDGAWHQRAHARGDAGGAQLASRGTTAILARKGRPSFRGSPRSSTTKRPAGVRTLAERLIASPRIVTGRRSSRASLGIDTHERGQIRGCVPTLPHRRQCR